MSEELAFEFHYFFTRKFWMVYHCQVRPYVSVCVHALGGKWRRADVVTCRYLDLNATAPIHGSNQHPHRTQNKPTTTNQALVVAPGGMGTLDELFEVLTLKQTGKVQPDLPVVLFGKAFWKAIINWQVRA